jgi:hypothetical protein
LARLTRCDEVYLLRVGPDNPAMHTTPEGASGSGWMSATGDPVPLATDDAGHPPQVLAALTKTPAHPPAPSAVPVPGAPNAAGRGAVGTLPTAPRSTQKR